MIPHKNILCFVMAGGRGTRLKILTRDTCKPMVDIFGHYKIFDFVARNIADTGIPITLVAMQCDQQSLARYIGDGKGWGFDGKDRRLEIVQPDSTENYSRFEGTADSVRKSSDRIQEYEPDIVMVLAADHVYCMNYSKFITHHSENEADITIMTNAVPENRVGNLGLVRIDESDRIVDFVEKPQDKKTIENFRLSPETKKRLGINDPELDFLASMGNYAFYWHRLKKFLSLPGMDFGRDIIPAIKRQDGSMNAFVFDGYWRDVGRIYDYFRCNMDLTNGVSSIKLLERQMRINGIICRQISPNMPCHHTILNSCDVIRRGSVITDSVLGHRVIIEEECELDHCILLGSERNGSSSGRISGRKYTSRIGRGSKLSYVILDENVCIGKGVNIGPHNGPPEKRKSILQYAGLKPYKEFSDGNAEGDFYIDPEAGILVIGRQGDPDPRKRILQDGLVC